MQDDSEQERAEAIVKASAGFLDELIEFLDKKLEGLSFEDISGLLKSVNECNCEESNEEKK